MIIVAFDSVLYVNIRVYMWSWDPTQFGEVEIHISSWALYEGVFREWVTCHSLGA